MSDADDRRARMVQMPDLLGHFQQQSRFQFTEVTSGVQEGRFARSMHAGFLGLQAIATDPKLPDAAARGEALHQTLQDEEKLRRMGFSAEAARSLHQAADDFADGRQSMFKASRQFGGAVKEEVQGLRTATVARMSSAPAAAMHEAHIPPTEAHNRMSGRRGLGLLAFAAAATTAVTTYLSSDDKPPAGQRMASGFITPDPQASPSAAAPAAEAPPVVESSRTAPAELVRTAASASRARPALARPAAEVSEPVKPDPQVADMQTFLLEQGGPYGKLMSDGVTGLRSAQFTNALTYFQQSHNLEATGELNRDTVMLANEIRQKRETPDVQAQDVDMSPLKALTTAKPATPRSRDPGPG